MPGKVKVNDNRLRSFRKKIKSLKGIGVTVGVQGNEALAEHPSGAMTMAKLALTHEFGTKDGRIPSRSFLRSTFDDNKMRYGMMMTKGGRKVERGQATAMQVMFQLGETVRADIIARIKAHIPPPLSEVTIARKGSDIPLIDKGHLLGSITSVVHKKGALRG